LTWEDIVIDEVIENGNHTSVAFQKEGKDEKMSIEANQQF
jgi:hypothetical protein